MVWSRFIERPVTDEYARDVLQLPNGDLVVLVRRYNPGTGDNTMELLRFSINGQDCTDLVFNVASTDDFQPFSLANVEGLPNSTATVAVGGYWRSGQQFLGIYLLQPDLSMAIPGPLLYDMFPANPEETPVPTGILQSGENLVVAGYLKKNSLDREAFLLSVRPFTQSGQVDGTLLWARRIRTNASNGTFGNGYRIYGLDKNNAGDLFVAGAAFGINDSFYRAFLLKANPDGMVQWIHLFPGNFGNESADNALAYDLDVTPEGSLLLSGYRPRPDSSDGFFWVGRADANGSLHNCDCFDPLSLQVENYQPEFSVDTSPEPTEIACDGGLAIPACHAFTPSQLFCDQYFPAPICEASFLWQPTNGCGTFAFTNQSTGPLLTYLWQFGDPLNSTSLLANPTFTYYSSGSFNVCLTITSAGCTDTYCEEITVDIQGAPAGLTCPDDAMLEVDPGACENSSFQLPEAAVVDNCPCDNLLDVSYSQGYNGPYPAGQHTFTVTAIDACGFVTCEVTVTVDDGEAPTITCPEEVTLPLGSSIDPAETGEPTATDPCGEATITYSDELVPTGDCSSRIDRTWIAADASGNADTCVQVIWLLDLTPPLVTCPDDFSVEVDPVDCVAILDQLDVVFEDDCTSPNDYEISYILTGVTNGSGLGLPIGLVEFQIGATGVEINVSTPTGVSASCTFTLTVTETVPPVITCPDVQCVVADQGTEEALVEFADPTAADNCSGVTVICNPISGSTFPLGATSVVCTASDAAGNSAVCSFTIEVFSEELSAAFVAEASSPCADTYVFTPAFLDPALNYAWNFGDGTTSVLPEPAHSFPGTGLYTVSLVLSTDSGCTAESSEVLDVVMSFNPIFFYDTECTNVAFDGLPDDPAYSWTWEVPGGPLEGPVVSASFPDFGTFEVCATVTDGACTQMVCQTIELADTEAPVLTCAGLSLATDSNVCEVKYIPDAPEAQDNCSGPGALMVEGIRDDNLALDDPWPLGVTCITWTATDEAGNSGACQQCITVADEEAPDITCPEDVTIEAETGATAAVVEFGNAEATDNCGNTSLTCSYTSGAEFPIGATEVTCTATDDAGNSISCTFMVTVLPTTDTCCVDSMGFVMNVNAGFSWAVDGSCKLTVTPKQLNGCQNVLEWNWGDGVFTEGPFAGNTEVSYTFAENGEYEVCMLVAELDEGIGAICWEATYCETLTLECGDPCALEALPIRTGYDYANGTPYGANGDTDTYWLESNGLPMATAPQIGGQPPLANSNWIVPMVASGYRDHTIEFAFCLPAGPFDCEDLVFDLGIKAWALATIRINGRPVSGPLFLSPAYGASATGFSSLLPPIVDYSARAKTS
ncbi:MAG: HYR domain-containing protein [Saprospirales bacterium]|nr:HYR domain-containing protein [Saprospirales bacterium]